MEVVFNLDDIAIVAKKFLEYTGAYKVFAFSGELGAGKTTFVHAICQQLGVKETVTSPTYAIIQEYNIDNNGIIYHIDMYRIKDMDEAIEAGVEDCLLSDNICMVEWPERGLLLFPPATVFCSLQTLSATTRKMIVQLPQ